MQYDEEQWTYYKISLKSESWWKIISEIYHGISKATASGAETRIFQNEVNIMAADAQPPYVARSSAAMLLTVQDRYDLVTVLSPQWDFYFIGKMTSLYWIRALVFHEEGFPLHAAAQ